VIFYDQVVPGSALVGYVAVFSVLALMLFGSLWMLSRIDVGQFRQRATQQMSVLERAALVE
jgi:hypothetical protein